MANIFSVTNSEELMSALASAKGGDTIELSGGDYGALNLNHQTEFNTTYDSPVTIVSVDAEKPASFGAMTLSGVSNLVFDNIQFDYTYEVGDALWDKPFSITNSSNITIKNSVFDGDVSSGTGTPSDGYGTGFGLWVWASSGVTVDNTEFMTWWKGAAFSRSTDLTITNNDIHEIRSDGVNFSEVQSVLFEGNHIYDFRVSKESGDHADMIQVISTAHATTTTADLTIRGNILDIGDGDVTQMIFMANGKYNATQDPAWFYQNITVEDNLIRGTHTHGISIGTTDGLTIRNNTLLDAEHPDGAAAPAIRTNQSTNVTIENNAVSKIVGADDPEPTWTIQNNLILQNDSPELVGYYDDQFLTSSTNGWVGAYTLNPGGDIARLGAGVTWMTLDTSPETPTTQFNIYSKGSDSQTLVFDASYTYGPTGVISDEDAEFHWTFGDGSTATGQIVEHKFGAAGMYDVTLQVVFPDGKTVKAESDARVLGSDVLAFNPDDGIFYLESYGQETAIAGTDIASVADGGGRMTVDLSATENLTEIRAQHLGSLFGSKSFDLSMLFQANQPGVSQGWLLHLKDALTVRSDQDGDIFVDIWDAAGARFKLSSTGLNVDDGGIHSFEIRLDDVSDTLQLVVDGALQDSTAFTGELSQGSHSLKFGSPWGNSFDGQMHAFDLDAIASDYSVYEGVASVVSVQEEPNVVVVGDEDQGAKPVDLAPDPSDSPTTSPESDTVPEEESNATVPESAPRDEPDTTAPESAPEDEASAPAREFDGFDVFASLEKQDHGIKFGDDAHVADIMGKSALILDGHRDYVNLGRIKAYETSDRITVDLEFQRNDPSDFDTLFFNKGRLGVFMNGDTLNIRVGQTDKPFHNGFTIKDTGLDNADKTHTLRVIADGESDRLQVIVNGEVVLDDSSRDLDLVQSGTGQWGYMIGTSWSSTFDGTVTGLEINDSAQFIPEDPMLSI